jgi:CDP-diacylglycerol--glycerol-3-phosphate 3-phosphatidyltransferase/cardiolipin synthase
MARARTSWTIADTITVLRLPLAVAFPLVHDWVWRLAILAVAAGTDLLDGPLARRFGSSRFGSFLDPLVDKLFMASAFGVVLFSGKLQLYEIVGVLARDIVAAAAFFAVTVLRRPLAIPARPGGKAVTVAQTLTLVAFLFDSPLLRPLAWATAAIALYAIWDYQRVARRQARPVGE